MILTYPLRTVAIVTAAAVLLVLGFGSGAYALHSPEHYSFAGDASYVTPGNASNRAVHLISDADPGFGRVDFGVEAGLTFAGIDALGTDFRFESDDSCVGGSPRFQVAVASTSGDTGNIFVYLGPPPSYSGCAADVWLTSGDLLEGVNPIDTSQLDGGTFYDPYASALVKYGDYAVTGIRLVADASWAFGDSEQAVDVDNTTVDTTLFTYEVPVPTDKEQCKKGGWMSMADDEGNPFKNQGQCVSYANHNN